MAPSKEGEGEPPGYLARPTRLVDPERQLAVRPRLAGRDEAVDADAEEADGPRPRLRSREEGGARQAEGPQPGSANRAARARAGRRRSAAA
jgi:hypothetical protein